MVAQYTAARVMGRLCCFSDCFRKKLTVIGIIGKTQGVTKDTSPQKTPVNTKVSKSLFWDAAD